MSSPADNWLGARSPKEIKAAQRADPNLLTVATWLKESTFPPHFPKTSSHQLQALWNQRHHLLLRNGIIYRQWRDAMGNGTNQKLQLVIPIQWVPDILTSLHDSSTAAHLGTQKTLTKIRERFYWVGQRRDVENWCQSCEKCATRKSPPRKPRAPLQTELATRPMERIAMDILGPLPETTRGNKYILVVGDYFTKWKEAFPMKDMEATTVAHLLVNEFICRFGLPDNLHTDQGRNFESVLIKEICSLLNIKKTRTTPYHPQSDGLIERFNRTLLNMLSIAAAEDERSWDLQLPTLMFAYRSSVQETTGSSPFNLMFGREARLPIDLELNLPAGECYTDKPVEQLKNRFSRAYERVRSHMQIAHQKQKTNYNRLARDKSYSVDAEVWLHNPAVPRGANRKFHRPWQGPFKVMEKIGEVLYRIQDVKNPRRHFTVHFNRLKPFRRWPNAGRTTLPLLHMPRPTTADPVPSGDSSTTANDGSGRGAVEDLGGASVPCVPGGLDSDTESSDDSGESSAPGNLDSDIGSSERQPAEPSQRVLRRSTRQRCPPDRYGIYVTLESSDSDG